MTRILISFVAGAIASALVTGYVKDSYQDTSLNTANTIGAAWEFRRLAEGLAANVETRCYVAQLADSQIENLLAAAEVIADHPSANQESDALAIRSVLEAVEIYEPNGVASIAEDCREISDA